MATSITAPFDPVSEYDTATIAWRSAANRYAHHVGRVGDTLADPEVFLFTDCQVDLAVMYDQVPAEHRAMFGYERVPALTTYLMTVYRGITNG